MIRKTVKHLWRVLNFKSSPYYERFDEFWIQKIPLDKFQNRFEFFEKICEGKNILHFGCTDWPIFNPNYNLHIKLAKVANNIHGFDIDIEGIENLKKHVNQDYFTNFEEVKGKYDVCIVPETIEHVDNVGVFLEGLSTIKADIFYITAPNCFSKKHMNRNFYGKDYFVEVVHPDHNCWYSPFTLKNQIEKYSELKVEKVYLLEDETMICCQAKKVNDK